MLTAVVAAVGTDTNRDPWQRWHGLGRDLPLVDEFLPNVEELRAVAAATGGPAAQAGLDELRRELQLG